MPDVCCPTEDPVKNQKGDHENVFKVEKPNKSNQLTCLEETRHNFSISKVFLPIWTNALPSSTCHSRFQFGEHILREDLIDGQVLGARLDDEVFDFLHELIIFWFFGIRDPVFPWIIVNRRNIPRRNGQSSAHAFHHGETLLGRFFYLFIWSNPSQVRTRTTLGSEKWRGTDERFLHRRMRTIDDARRQ